MNYIFSKSTLENFWNWIPRLDSKEKKVLALAIIVIAASVFKRKQTEKPKDPWGQNRAIKLSPKREPFSFRSFF